MSRTSTNHPHACVTCMARITGQAVFHIGLPFCCAGCAAGGPCTCSYDEPAPDDQPALAGMVLAAALADRGRG